MPYLRIWIHLVWTTKDQSPLLTKNIRSQVFNHIKEYCATKSIHLDHINGYNEHVHLLISLKSEQNIATLLNLIKGESSHWINKNKLSPFHFGWQNDYFAASVSHSQIHKVRNYIRGQENHHATKTWHEEYNEFITKYGFEKG